MFSTLTLEIFNVITYIIIKKFSMLSNFLQN
jgi:hypothetical protein